MKKHLLPILCMLLSLPLAQSQTVEDYYHNKKKDRYVLMLDDAILEVGARFSGIFALDDRASLSSNPHFEAMWNLVKLGANLEALLQGESEPINDINLGKKFGKNGYNNTVVAFFVRYGFGESTDGSLQRHFFELSAGPGLFKGGNGMNLHVDYYMNIAKTNYGAGGQSIARSFDYEIYAGARVGYDWSFRRSESEAGFFTHLNDEIKRIADENEFTASQLIKLQELAETSRVLLPKDVGGRVFHVGPVVGIKVSKEIIKNVRIFVGANGFYDLMDLGSGRSGEENIRSQHHAALQIGASMTLGAEGLMTVNRFF
ncbi:hypothetical protein [Flavilitoribacter nigricans]|nr:hypothetical protein [Flavilitoribacter nigricans]